MTEALIDKLPGRMGGVACIAGTRLNVATIIGANRAGWNIDELIENYPFVTREQVQAAFAYYHDNPLEIEAELADDVPDYPPGTVKIDHREIRVEKHADGHVLIGDEDENIVLAPESALYVLRSLQRLIDQPPSEPAGKLPSEEIEDLARRDGTHHGAGISGSVLVFTVEPRHIVEYLDRRLGRAAGKGTP